MHASCVLFNFPQNPMKYKYYFYSHLQIKLGLKKHKLPKTVQLVK